MWLMWSDTTVPTYPSQIQNPKTGEKYRSNFIRRHFKKRSFHINQAGLQKVSVQSDVLCTKLKFLFRLSCFQTKSLLSSSKQVFQDHPWMQVLICIIWKKKYIQMKIDCFKRVRYIRTSTVYVLDINNTCTNNFLSAIHYISWFYFQC